MDLERNVTSVACPACGHEILVDRRFVPWCDACEWNVDVGVPPPSTHRLDRLVSGVSGTLASRLAAREDLASASGRRFGRAIVVAVSIVVVGLWVCLGIGGIWIVFNTPGFLPLVGGVLVLAAFASRPRFYAAPQVRLDPATTPALHRFVADIADRMGSRVPDAIAFDEQWNAVTYRFGVRQRTAMVIGMPVWRALGPAARAALVGHELGHRVNGDLRRGMLVGTAIETLVTWAAFLTPEDITGGDRGLTGIVMIPLNIVLYAIAHGIRLIVLGILVLTFHDGRRAEFLADRKAASAAGIDGTRTALRTIRDQGAFERAVATVVRRSLPPGDLYAALVAELDATPPSATERLDRLQRRAGPQLGETHPPMYQRLERLAVLEGLPDAMVVDPELMAAIDRELAPFEEAPARAAADAYRLEILG